MEKYLAFISYRHQPDDSDAALRLRKGLEGFHLPKDCPLPKKRTVFRDTDELPTSSDLGADIENALRDSGWLIALCSEEYVRSRWCRREIEIFLQLGRKDRILPVLVSGTPEVSIPEEIRDLPLAADLRKGYEVSAAKTEGQSEMMPSYDRGRTRASVPLLLSLMSGTASARIAGSERRFRAAAAFAAVFFLTAGLLGFASYANKTAERIDANNGLISAATEETEEKEREAIEERNTALLKQAEYVSRLAWGALAQEDTDKAIELALSVLPEDLHGDLPVSPEAAAVLRTALSMELPPSYHFFTSVETDFQIDDYYVHPGMTEKLFLTEDHIRTSEHYLDYSGQIGDLETDMADSRQNAVDQGYTKLYYVSGDANSKRHIYCGPGLPLYSEGFLGNYHTVYTLGGEPFLADDMACGDDLIVAWRKDGAEGSCRTALFRGSAEALKTLEIAGMPVSVSFSGNGSYFIIVDDTGGLYLFDYKGGLKKTFSGNYTYALYYYNKDDYLYAGTRDGAVICCSLERMEEVFRIDCGSAVREIRADRDKRALLLRCDSGVYLHHLVTGTFLSEIGSGETPKRVLFQEDRGNSGTDARMILMIYDRRIDLYGLDTETDSSLTDYRPLISEGVPVGKRLWYSQDGRRIFQRNSGSVNDPGEDMLYCWDAATGGLLWKAPNPRKDYDSFIYPCSDGKTSWRIYEEGTLGVERFDEETGRILFSVCWDGRCNVPSSGGLSESPDGSKGLLLTMTGSYSFNERSQLLFAFDTSDGRELWRMALSDEMADWKERYGDGYELVWASPGSGISTVDPAGRAGKAKAVFSEDGKLIYLAQRIENEEKGVFGCVFDTIDVDTGEIIDERYCDIGACSVYPWEEERAVVVIDSQPEEVNKPSRSIMKSGVWYYPTYIGEYDVVTVTHTVRIYDLVKGGFRAEIPFSYTRSPEANNRVLEACRPFSGGMALYWESRNEDDDGQDYCCRLYPDGTTGSVFRADTEEGRRLWVSEEDYLVFQGEEAFTYDTKMYRLSDASAILAGVWASSLYQVQDNSSPLLQSSSGSDRSIAFAPDGSSICVFSRYNGDRWYPFMIYPSDLDTLVEKAKKRMEILK